MSFQEDPENNRLVVFIPKCKICKTKMIDWDIRGIVGQGEVGGGYSGPVNLKRILQDSSISPSITYLNLVYKCPKHDDIYFKAPPDMLDRMNRFPAKNIEYHHVEF